MWNLKVDTMPQMGSSASWAAATYGTTAVARGPPAAVAVIFVSPLKSASGADALLTSP